VKCDKRNDFDLSPGNQLYFGNSKKKSKEKVKRTKEKSQEREVVICQDMLDNDYKAHQVSRDET
jgi:primase-polymerase (primpol)-like protein